MLFFNVGKGVNGDMFIGDFDNYWVVVIVEFYFYKRIIYCDFLVWSFLLIFVDVINNFISYMLYNLKI